MIPRYGLWLAKVMVDLEGSACDLFVATDWVHIIQVQLAETIRGDHIQGHDSGAVEGNGIIGP